MQKLYLLFKIWRNHWRDDQWRAITAVPHASHA